MAVTKKDVEGEAPKPEKSESKGSTYAYIGTLDLAVVVVGGSTYDFRKGEHVNLPEASKALESHPDFVKVK